MAVTCILVISRIMADLGILGARFARIVLSVAVLEDLLVYVVLNLALALVARPAAEAFSLPSLLSLRPASILGNSYYIVVTLAFFTLPALLGPGFVGRLVGLRGNVVHRASPIAFQLAFLLALTGLAAFLGASPIFGAMLAGILAATCTAMPSKPGRRSRASPTPSSFRSTSPWSACAWTRSAISSRCFSCSSWPSPASSRP